MELALLAAAMQSRENYLAVEKLMKKGDLSDMGNVVYNNIKDYYQRDGNAPFIDTALLLQMIQQRHENHADKFAELFNNLPNTSDVNVLEHMKEVRLQSIGLKISNALDMGKHEDASELMLRYKDIQEIGLDDIDDESGIKVYNDCPIEDINEAFSEENLIPIYPKALGDIFGGGAMRGDHALFFAPPETGKSLLAINMACGAAAHGLKVLYCGNEDPAKRMLMRIVNRLSGMTRADVVRLPDEAMERARKRGYTNITFVELAPGSTDDIKELCRTHEPDVCIVDQLSNLILSGQKQPSKTELLEKLAYELRMFYKKTGIFGISMSQADEKAIGKLMLGIENVYYSNIGVQGQVDIMVGIGCDDNYRQQNRRMLSVVKNKVSGEHTHLNVTVVPTLSQVKAI